MALQKELGFKTSLPVKKRIRIIGVIGGNRADSLAKRTAFQLGKLIAEAGYVMVCGGLGGVMESACKGTSQAGGVSIGVLPGKSRNTANPYVTIPIVTAMSHARNAVIVRTADVLVAIDGKYGTLSEIALAKALGKKVIGLNTWDIPGVEPAGSVQEAMEKIQ